MNTALLERIPPQNLEAEQNVLGAMLIEREAISEALAILHEDDFYRDAHRILFGALREMYHAGQPVDSSLIKDHLESHGTLEDAGGMAYICQMMNQVPTAGGIRHYSRIVRAKSFLRECIRQADGIMQRAYTAATEDAERVMSEAEGAYMQMLDNYASGSANAQFTLWYDIEQQVIQSRREADAAGIDVGFRTPLERVNKIITPVCPTDLVIVGARPGVGKTSFGIQWAYELATQGFSGLVVSLEMSKDQLAYRRLLAATGLNRWRLDTLVYRQQHAGEIYPPMEDAAEQSLPLKLAVCDTPDMTPSRLSLLARRAKKKFGGLDFVLIDYLQLMDADKDYRDLRETYTAVSKALKGLAKRERLSVIALAQLTRAAEGMRPNKAQLRESGQIEQDADKIIMLHWPNASEPTVREIGLEKQRNGPTDWCAVGFCPAQTWFYQTPDDVPGRE